jgi:hypothetical protein
MPNIRQEARQSTQHRKFCTGDAEYQSSHTSERRYKMKKIITVLIALALCLTNAPTAAALAPDNLNASSSKITSDGINNVAEDQAEMFRSLGLFLGTDQGFELYRRMTRAEAGTLIVRFMGEEKAALAQNNRHPFRDVPSWADPYVGWLYKNNIVIMSNTESSGARISINILFLASASVVAFTAKCISSFDVIGSIANNSTSSKIIKGANKSMSAPCISLSSSGFSHVVKLVFRYFKIYMKPL